MRFMNLIVVESPTKARTLSRFLEGDFAVEATYGHVQDLPQKKLGVIIEQESGRAGEYRFELQYEQLEKQQKRMDEIKKLAGKTDKIYLATDPDREGEAIAYHVSQILKNGKKQHEFVRIVFHEITKKAIQEALEHPQKVDRQLVEAQQARRVLDRLVGYKLSPLLWRKVRKGLSAGRVQSVAVRLVVEREREILAFKPEEYWQIFAEVEKMNIQKFQVQLTEREGEKIKVGNGVEAEKIKLDLEKAAYCVAGVSKREFKKSPPAPFTTSTLQQAGANKLGWSAKRTMQVAQSLYEEGHITYHRTDSTNLAVEAVAQARDFIAAKYGKEFVPATPRIYQTKSKVAQEAHEAIRPTEVNVQYSTQPTGGQASNVQWGKDEGRLYELIWKRFLACQMADTAGEETKVTVRATGRDGEYQLEVKGQVVKFEGWKRLYESSTKSELLSSNGEEDKVEEVMLPELTEGEKLNLLSVLTEQKFTQPPARFNDASLIKALEEKGIGRPSTYAPTLTTIQDRQYVEKTNIGDSRQKRFSPTALGMAVNDFLTANFPEIVDFEFTARMEDELDNIAAGERQWQPVLSAFYGPFEKNLVNVSETAQRVHIKADETGNPCPKCGEGREIVRIGKFGRFLACSRYPECDYKRNYVKKAGVLCPKCGGDVIMRRTKTGKNFFGCSNYPKCDFASWTKPKAAATTEVTQAPRETT